jgi:ubiquinone/menaquinone biosynthesis C-methylase UbiE
VKTFRQRYYDFFSRFYDGFVTLHSRDRSEDYRTLVANSLGLKMGDKILDVCTGTGTALAHVHKRVGRGGLVVGMDFSWGMLKAAQGKTSVYDNLFLVQGDAGHLPFKAGIFDAVTCSFAFYELTNETEEEFLKGVGAILKAGQPFVMIEHDLPSNVFIRLLFYIRLFSMGGNRAREILKHETDRLARHFKSVDKIEIPTSKSKMMLCRNSRDSLQNASLA